MKKASAEKLESLVQKAVSQNELLPVTTLFAQKLFPRFTGFQLPAENDSPDSADTKIFSNQDFQTIYRELCANEERNKLIVADILNAYRERRECLVLSERLEHLAVLHAALQDNVTHLFMLKGGMGKKQLKAIMDGIHNVPNDECRVIIATGKFIGEGFDLPCFDTLFLVFPFSWKGTLKQYTGRLNRAYYGKKEIRVYDYVDEKVPVLSRMYGKRLRGYRGLGFVAEDGR